MEKLLQEADVDKSKGGLASGISQGQNYGFFNHGGNGFLLGKYV